MTMTTPRVTEIAHTGEQTGHDSFIDDLVPARASSRTRMSAPTAKPTSSPT